MKNLIKFIKNPITLIVGSIAVFAMLFAFAIPTSNITAKAIDGEYGEIRLTKTSASGYNYTLVIAGNGYIPGNTENSGRFAKGSIVSIYVVGNYEKGEKILSSLVINNEIVPTSEQIPLTNNGTSFNQNAGGYPIYEMPIYQGTTEQANNETRYLVHREAVTGALTISADFSNYEVVRINTHINSNAPISFNYYALVGENLASKLNEASFIDVAKNIYGGTASDYFFDGFYTKANSQVTKQNLDRAAENGASEYSAQVYSKNTTTIGTKTLQFGPTTPGGTAKVVISNTLVGLSDQTTKYFTEGSANFTYANGKLTFTADAAEGYTFLGWYSSSETISNETLLSNQKSYSPASIQNTVIAVFAKTYNIVVLSENCDILGIPAVFAHGQSVTLVANAKNNTSFGGWIINGVIVEAEAEYTFNPEDVGNCTIFAGSSHQTALDVFVMAQPAIDGSSAIDISEIISNAQINNNPATELIRENLSYSVPAGQLFNLSLTLEPNVVVSCVSLNYPNLSTIGLEFEQNGSTLTINNLELFFSSSLVIETTLEAETTATEIDCNNDMANDATIFITKITSPADNTVKFVKFWVNAHSGYSKSEPTIGNIYEISVDGIDTQLEDVLFSSQTLNTLNNEIFGNLSGNYISLNDLLTLLSTGSVTVNNQTISLNVLLTKLNTVVATAVSGTEILDADEYVGILINNNLVSSAEIEQNSEFTISAKNIIEISNKTYIFSHFLVDGCYFDGHAAGEYTQKALTSTGSIEICAVYREAVEVLASTIVNEREKDNAISANVFGESFSFGALPLNEQISISAPVSVLEDETNCSFSHFVLNVNGNDQIITTSSFELTIENASNVISIAVFYNKQISYENISSSTEYNTNKTNTSALLTYSNGTYTFSQSNTFAGSVQVSKAAANFGEQISFSATSSNGFTFVGWFEAEIGGNLAYNSTCFKSNNKTYTQTANDNISVVAVFAEEIEVTALSSSANNVEISNTFTGAHSNNQMFTYKGANLLFETESTNFIGYYSESNLSLPLSLQNTYEFTASQSANFVALFGNKALTTIIATNFNSLVEAGGSVSAATSDGRNISNASQSPIAFATQHGKNIVLTATSAQGYTFLGWFNDSLDGSLISTSTTLRIEQSSSRTIVAHFAQEVELTYSVVGQGVIFNIPQNVYVGQTLSNISASPLSGYKLQSLSILNDGQAEASSFIVAGNIEIVATFSAIPQIIATAIVPANGNQFAGSSNFATVKINNLSAVEFVDGNAAISVSNIPQNYEFVHFLVNEQETAATTNENGTITLLLNDVSQNTNVVAVFNQTISVSSSVSTIGGENGGTISGLSGTGIVGSSQTFTATASLGYSFTGFNISGRFIPISSTATSLTLELSTSDISVIAVFTKIINITVSIPNENGSLLINGNAFSNGNVANLPYGELATIEFIPSSGYMLSEVSGVELNAGNSGSFVPTENTTISATFAEIVKINIVSNVEIGNAPTASATIPVAGKSGENQTRTTNNSIFSIVVPKGTTTILSADLSKTINGVQMVFVGFYKNTTPFSYNIDFVGTAQNYAFANGKVQVEISANENISIIARYEVATEVLVRSADGNSFNTSKDNFVLKVNGNAAPYLISEGTISNNILSLLVPNNLSLEISAADFSAWYFVATSQTQNLYYNYNKVSSTSTFSFVASRLNTIDGKYMLLAAKNQTETTTSATASATLENPVSGGSASISGATITATANEGYVLAYWEIKTAVSVANFYIAIPGENQISASVSGSILSIADTTGTIFSGYGTAIRPVFEAASEDSTTVQSTFFVNASAAFGSLSKTYIQAKSGTNQTISISLNGVSYQQIGENTRAYLVGWSVNGSASYLANTSISLQINANTTVIALFEIRVNVNDNYVQSGSTQTIYNASYEKQIGSNNDYLLFNGFSSNVPLLITVSNTTNSQTGLIDLFSFSFAAVPAQISCSTYAAKGIVVQNSSNSIAHTANGVLQNGETTNVFTDENGYLTISYFVNSNYKFVTFFNVLGSSYIGTNPVLSSANIASASTISLKVSQSANIAIAANNSLATFTTNMVTAIGEQTTIAASAISNYSTPSNQTILLQSGLNFAYFNYEKIHTISITINGDGLAQSSSETAINGSTITLSALANEGSTFVGFEINGVIVSTLTEYALSCFQNFAITALFEQTTTITIPASSHYITSFGNVGTGSQIQLAESETANVLVCASSGNVLLEITIDEQTTSIFGQTSKFVSNTNKSIFVTECADINFVVNSNISDVSFSKEYTASGIELSYTLPTNAASSFETLLNRVLVFDGWYNQSGTKLSDSATFVVTTLSETNIEARFIEYFRVEVAAPQAGGSIALSLVSTNNGFFEAGTTITVTATANSGYYVSKLFVGQTTAASTNVLGSVIEQTFIVTSHTTISAQFVEIVTLTFNISDALSRSVVGGIIGISSSALPVETISTVSGDNTQIIAKVVKGSSVIITLNPILGNTLVSVNGEAAQSSTITLTATASQTFNVVFTKTYVATPFAITTFGDDLDVGLISLTQTNNSVVVKANVTTTNSKLAGIMVITASGEITYYPLSTLVQNEGIAEKTVVLAQNSKIIALYAPKLNVTVSNNIDGESSIDNIYDGSKLELTAEEKEGYKFVGFFIGNKQISDQDSFAFICQNNMQILATYTSSTKINVNIETYAYENNSGSMAITEDAVAGVIFGNGEYFSTDFITLVATPAEGYSFVGWYNNNNELISSAQVFYYPITSSQIPTKAVFEKLYKVVIQTNLSNAEIGALISHNGTYAATTENGQVVVCGPKHTQITINSQAANGYKLESGQTSYEITDNSTIVLNYVATNTLTISTETKGAAPDTAGQVTVNGGTISESSYEIDFNTTTTFTIGITLPIHSTNSYCAQIFVNGVLAETYTSNAEYVIECSTSTTINVVFAQLVSLSVSTYLNNVADSSVGEITIFVNGKSQNLDLSNIPYGSTIVLHAKAEDGYSFVKFEEDSELKSNSSIYSFVIESDRTVSAVFTERLVNFEIYFPESIRKMEDTTGANPAPILCIKENGTQIAEIDAAFESENQGDVIITISNDGDYVVVSVPYTYSEILTAEFKNVVWRADVSLNGTIISAPNRTQSSSADVNIPFTILAENESALSNKIFQLSYTAYVRITISIDGKVGVLLNGDSFTFSTSTKSFSTTSTNSAYGSQVISDWFVVGQKATLSATENNPNEVSGATLDFDSFLLLNKNFFTDLANGETSYITSEYVAPFDDWRSGSSRPSYAQWANLLNINNGVGYTTIDSTFIIGNNDITIVADYLDLEQNGSKYIFAVLNNNGLTDSSYEETIYGLIKTNLTQTNVSYTIYSENQLRQIAINSADVQNRANAGFVFATTTLSGGDFAAEHSNKDIFSNIVNNQKVNAYISAISKYFEQNVAQINALSKKTGTIDTNIGAITSSSLVDNEKETIPASISFAEQDNESGINFLGYYIKTNNINNEQTSTTFTIMPGNKIIVDELGNPINSYNNYIKIPSSNQSYSFNIVGPYEIVALYEKNIYQITTTQLAAIKTVQTEKGQQFNLDGTSYIVELSTNSDIVLKAENGETITWPSNIVNIKKVGNGDSMFFIVYTTDKSNTGTIRGSLIFEQGNEADLNAYTRMYGEFAGYQFTNGPLAGLGSTTIMLNDQDVTSIVENNSLSIIEPIRENDVAIAQQHLKFKVTCDSALNVYFTALRYRINIVFAEFTNEGNKNEPGATDSQFQDLYMLFNESYNETDGWPTSTTNEISASFTKLGNIYNYVTYAVDDANSQFKGNQTPVNAETKPNFTFYVHSDTAGEGENITTIPVINGSKISTSFYVSAEAGSGFETLSLNYINSIVSGSTMIIRPNQNGEYEFNYDNLTAPETLNLHYNCEIDVEDNAELIDSMLSEVTIYIVKKCEVANVSIDNNDLTRTTEYSYVNKYNTHKGKPETTDTIETSITNGVNIMLVKGANKYKSMLENFSNTTNWQDTAAFNYINNYNSTDTVSPENNTELADISLTEIELVATYANLLSLPYSSFIPVGSELKTPGEYFADDNYVNSSYIKYKIQLENGRYLDLVKDGYGKYSVPNSQENAPNTCSVDFNKYRHTYTNGTYNNNTGLVSFESDSYQLIVYFNYDISICEITDSIENGTTVEIQLIKLPNNKKSSIATSQDDMLFAITSVNPLFTPQITIEEGNFITNYFRGTNIKRANAPLMLLPNVKLEFSASTQKNADFVFANSAGASTKSLTYNADETQTNAYYKALELNSLFETITYTNVQNQISMLNNKIDAEYSGSTDYITREGYTSKTTHQVINKNPISISAMVSINGEVLNNATAKNISLTATSETKSDDSNSIAPTTIYKFVWDEMPFNEYPTSMKALVVGTKVASAIVTAASIFSAGTATITAIALSSSVKMAIAMAVKLTVKRLIKGAILSIISQIGSNMVQAYLTEENNKSISPNYHNYCKFIAIQNIIAFAEETP